MTDRSGEEGGVGVGCTRVVMATEHLYVQNPPVSPESRGEYSVAAAPQPRGVGIRSEMRLLTVVTSTATLWAGRHRCGKDQSKQASKQVK